MARLPGSRYHAVAVVLHWAIAAAVLANLWVGWWMTEALESSSGRPGTVAAFQLHKSLGLAILALTLLRLGWRLVHRRPPLPAATPAWERAAAHAVHWAFYALLLAVPLCGWFYVSAQWRGDTPLQVPTIWFGLFEVPHLFDASALPAADRKLIAVRAATAHVWLAWSMAGLLAVHAAAALKHQFVNRDAVFASMAPRAGAAVFAAVALAVLAAWFAAPRAAGDGAIAGVPGSWIVDPASEITFEGVNAGEAFRGRFTRWQADIRFNPLASSIVTVAATIDTASATDGVPLHDETLLLPEWFDVERYPQARFVATRVAARPGGGHTVEGALTIKDRIVAVPPLDLDITDDALVIQGRFTVDRAEANLGMESDPDFEYVSRRIQVEVNVRAVRPES